MSYKRPIFWRSFLVVALVLALTLPASLVLATDSDGSSGTGPNPLVTNYSGPRTDPRAIPHHKPVPAPVIANELANFPVQSSEAAATATKDKVEGKPGILKTQTELATGTTLFHRSNVCNTFDTNGHWASRTKPATSELWTDWYAGWAPFAVNDGGYYQAKNTVFSKENVVGPGRHYDDDGTGSGDTVDGRHSVAIGSTEPYAGGFGSPMISVPAGAEVTVVVRYLIYNHGGKAADWASLGVKPDATGNSAVYVNGYTRGQWAEMRNTVTAGSSGRIMVLLQGQSPTRLNSKIYFDDVEIWVNGAAMTSCTYE
jgi:hypothetical protein